MSSGFCFGTGDNVQNEMFVRQHFANYFKLYGKNRPTGDVISMIGSVILRDVKYHLFERGQFGWWEDDDRMMILLWTDNSNRKKGMLYNYSSGKWVVSSDHLDVYYLWYKKVHQWLNQEGNTVDKLKELGYKNFVNQVFKGNFDVNGGNNNGMKLWSDTFVAVSKDREFRFLAVILLFYVCFFFYVTIFDRDFFSGNVQKEVICYNGDCYVLD